MTSLLQNTLRKEFSLKDEQLANVLNLFVEGATIPFIARYRKELTGSLDEIILRSLRERFDYLTELEERKETVIKTINDLGKLTAELKKEIDDCIEKTRLEDLYLPYKPKRKTRATTARERGLEPLYEWIVSQTNPAADEKSEAAKYINEELLVKGVDDALQGAADIFAEQVAETAEYRDFVRSTYLTKGLFRSKVRKDYEGKKSKYEMYYDYSSPVREIPSHNMLALRRAEKEEVVSFEISADDDTIVSYITAKSISIGEGSIRKLLSGSVKDGYERLMKLSISAEVRLEKKRVADLDAISTFEKNLRELLLAPPAGLKRVLAVDPGFRTGCKIVALDESGKMLNKVTVFPNEPQKETEKASNLLRQFIENYKAEFIVIGNGTASRETELFCKQAVSSLKQPPHILLVSEAGASIYSASDVAIREFPDLDLTIRSAISIGRRFQDPLSELVKIDAKSIGVGQYQHDVDQTLLKKKLEEVTESCVNFVGVELNNASAELLSFVAGLNRSIAENVVKHRDKNGFFKSRKELLSVPRLGAKAFEQCAPFLRIRGAENPLDNSAVHPESYHIVQKMADKLGLSIAELLNKTDRLKELDKADFCDEKSGIETITDIIEELKKPGRDPREKFTYAKFTDGITEISHLKEGMILEGVVTNVANFGAFVDIGVHQDGLVHVSKMADRFITDPHSVVKVGQVVKVKVVSVDEDLKRISLTMRPDDFSDKKVDSREIRPVKQQQKVRIAPPSPPKGHTLADLIKKFHG